MSKYPPQCIECGANTTGQKPRCKPCGQRGINSGDRNSQWVGDKVKYVPLHNYVRRHKPMPKLCEDCQVAPPRDLANKGIYDRNLENWEYLCRRCHMIKDGRMKNLVQFHA